MSEEVIIAIAIIVGSLAGGVAGAIATYLQNKWFER